MAIASPFHTMSANSNSTSSNGFLLSRNDLPIADSQLIDILLHSQINETKIQTVNHWCKNVRRNRLSTILDVSQRHDVLLSLVTTLEQTTNTEYQYNCLTLLSELQGNIPHYDQRTYLPAIIQCFASTSNDVQTLTGQVLLKQIRSTQDLATFLFLYTQDGLKSTNLRLRVKAIQTLEELLNEKHQYENLSPIFELLLQYLQDHTMRSTNTDTLVAAVQHVKGVLGPELLRTYLETFSPSLKRVYYQYVPRNENDQQIPSVDTDLDDDEETPRASVQVSHIKDPREKTPLLPAGTLTLRPLANNYHDEPHPLFPIRKLSLTPSSSVTAESSDFHSIVDLIRSNWLPSHEPDRLAYLERFKQACDRYLQSIRTQHLSTVHETQFHQVLHGFLTAILDLLYYLTSSNLDLTIKIKLVLSTCLGWLIKHAQVNYCKKNYTVICNVFKNILLNGQSNNRQLAKLSVSLILLLENFVQPQLILNELIDENFQYYNYRIQLEMLAIVTATLLKYRQYQYESLAKVSKCFFPMLVSNRRELRHGALECFTVICSYFNSYKAFSPTILETNQSIKHLFSSIELLSVDAASALRFRLLRNVLPSLTEEGNITPGLVCDSTTINDSDANFILSVNTPAPTPTLMEPAIPPPISAGTPSAKLTSTHSKLLQLAMPFAAAGNANSHTPVMRSREIPPLKPSDADLDAQRFNNHRFDGPLNQTTIITPGAPPFDFAITGSNSHRSVALTEKLPADEPAKKLPSAQTHSKDTAQKQEANHTNSLQYRPLIVRRSSLSRTPRVNQPLVTSQAYNHPERQPIQQKRQFDAEPDHDESVDSAIESRSVSINTGDDVDLENEQRKSKKPVRSVHSSSTRRKVDRLFSTGSDFESASARTLTPENSNESGVYSQSGRDPEHDTNAAEKSPATDQLFSTKPRLARSGSKSKLDRSQLPPTDPSLSARQIHDSNSNGSSSHRTTTSNVEVIGKGYSEEKHSARQLSTESIDDKQAMLTKPRAKIIKGSVVPSPLNTTTHTNMTLDDGQYHDEDQDIGVVGKAVHLPLRIRSDTDGTRLQNTNLLLNRLSKRNDSVELVSDEFDSDSKENENFVEMGQSLSASFRLRVQQKTQEKIEQKERRRQDREHRRRQSQLQSQGANPNDLFYDSDLPVSSTSTSRYSSQPDLTSVGNELPPTSRRQGETILPNVPSQQRIRSYKNPMARSQTFNNRPEQPAVEPRIGFHRPLSEDRVTEPLRNPEAVYKEAMISITNDDWERKCSGLSLIQRLVAQYPDVITQNLHQVVLVLIHEVKNLRSQVARFALATFCDMFEHLKRNMDIELDITVKVIILKSGESNEFFRAGADKCLQTMVENVTLQKALQALIAGGASHRNPPVRKSAAKYIYLVCEKLGPNKILSGGRDITERVLQVAAAFASDGPPEIRWYGKKIYHMLMPFDELEPLMKQYLAPAAHKNMTEILDSIRAKGGVGETPSESAKNNGRRAPPSDKLFSASNLSSQFSAVRKVNTADQTEQVRELTKQIRSSDFRERLHGIEEFQKLCELETNTAIQFLVPIFDGFNECLEDTNSKVLLKALNTMHQLVPILGDALASNINSVLPIVAQSIASKNREISQLASDIIDAAIDYIDCGCLLQPLCMLSQTSNLRVRPEIVLKLATLVPRVCQRKPKQVEIHLLPTYWKLLAMLRGQNSTAITSSAGGSNSLNSSIHVLTTALYAEFGSTLLDRASSSSMVTPKNLQMLRELCTNIDAV